MGAGASIPATEEEALAAGYTSEQIAQYKIKEAEAKVRNGAPATPGHRPFHGFRIAPKPPRNQ